MNTLAVLEGGSKYRTKKSDEKKLVRPHCKVSIEDVNWVRKQSPAVQQLWLDCIAVEQFGGSHHTLDTNLSYNAISKAKKALLEKNLFDFKPIREGLPSGRSGVVGYQVQNLHGYYNKHYWELADTHEMKPETHEMKTEDQQMKPQVQEMKPESHEKKPESHEMKLNSPETPTQQDFQNPNNVINNELTTSQQPTKVVEEGVGVQATAPLGGALPQNQEPEKLTELPQETEPAPQALTSGEIINILENANRGICPPKELITSLLVSQYAVSFISALNMNPQWGIEMKSFTTVDQKSVKNKQLRLKRKSQIKLMGLYAESPNLEFLQECWDDVLLKTDIKVAIAKNPSWNITVVDGELTQSCIQNIA